MLDFDHCYKAVQSKDSRFDGQFFTAVTSTHIYCRPSCPALTPRRQNVRFFRTAAAAHLEGFRACKRCRPDASPGSPEWDVRRDLVGRAMKLISDGLIDREGVEGLAGRLGYSARQLNRQLVEEVGAGPLALARAHRAQTARVLLETTALPVTEVAYASGFKSIRQFNDTIREVFAVTPTQLRGTARKNGHSPAGSVSLRLPFRMPYDAQRIFDMIGGRAVAGVESYDGTTYLRSLDLPKGPAIVELRATEDHIACTLSLEALHDLGAAVERCRRLLDLDADPDAISNALDSDRAMKGLVQRFPGLRVFGAVSPFELAVRAILGQQVSISAAATLAGRLTARYGNPLAEPRGPITHTFPSPEALAEADAAQLSIPKKRGEALVTFARTVANGDILLDAGSDLEKTREDLMALPGIGPWTADYIAMRGLKDPDVFLAGDLGVRNALIALGHKADPRSAEDLSRRWRPWRSYATQYLWASLENPLQKKEAG